MDKSRDLTTKWISLRITEKYNNALFPVDVALLLRMLPNIGYVVNKKLLKGVIEPGEPLVTKGNLELLINSDNKVLGMEGREITEILDGFCEVRKYWLEELKPSPGPETSFVELHGEGVIRSQKDPLKVFSEFWKQDEKIGKIGKIIGCDITNFGLRLTPRNAEPNTPDWFDLRLNPHVIASASHYYISLVWRHKDFDTALSKFKGASDMLSAVIREVER